MNVNVNGENVDVPDGTTIAQLLTLQEVKMPDMVSVELNGEIADRSAFETSVLSADDAIELLYFMGGGSAE